MKPRKKKRLLIIFLALGVVALSFLCGHEVFAGEAVTSGRKLWNNIMLWVNFGILAFLFLKYAKKPLAGLLRKAQDKIKTELDTISGRLEEAKSIRNEEADNLKDIEVRLEELRKGILELGRLEKEKIIEESKMAGDRMIQSAKSYPDYRMSMARKTISDEMVDIAISVAEEGLRKRITEEDNEKLVSQFISYLETSEQEL